ncbi:unnamed protein product, partial [Ectocarpus sp. 4 AP-2014]
QPSVLPRWTGCMHTRRQRQSLWSTDYNRLARKSARSQKAPFAAASGVETVHTPSWPFRLHWRWTSPRIRAR